MQRWLNELRHGWQGTGEPSSVLSIAFAAFCLMGGTSLRGVVALFRPDSPFSLYLPAVVLAAVFGGLRVGVGTLVSGGLLGFLLNFGDTPTGASRLALLAIYLIIGALVIWGVTHYRSLLARQREFSQRLIQEEAYRKLVVNELQHRLKNQFLSVLAIIRQTLQDQPEAIAKLDGRIRALSATDDLISKADDKGYDIKDLLLSELGPYGHVRFSLDGTPVYLPAKLAVSVALMFHELATNAAKHGAFSSPNGLLQVSWTVDEGFLSLIWDEAEGPLVKPSGHAGFGTKLLGSALAAFEGTTDLQFLQTGLRCTMQCRIPPA